MSVADSPRLTSPFAVPVWMVLHRPTYGSPTATVPGSDVEDEPIPNPRRPFTQNCGRRRCLGAPAVDAAWFDRRTTYSLRFEVRCTSLLVRSTVNIAMTSNQEAMARAAPRFRGTTLRREFIRRHLMLKDSPFPVFQSF